MAFNPNEHMMQLKGKDYLQVAWRLVWFREDHPDWGLNAECLEHDEDHAIFKATITDENGVQKSSGHGSESKKDFGDYLEKAETKAVGEKLIERELAGIKDWLPKFYPSVLRQYEATCRGERDLFF